MARMRRPDSAFDLPGIHALHLAELVRRWGVAPEVLLDGIVAPPTLQDPDTRISVRNAGVLVERARALTREPGIALHLGLQMRISAHGELGFTAMVAPTLRAALDVVATFGRTRSDAIAIRTEVRGGTARVLVQDRCDLGSAQDVILIGMVVGLVQIGSALIGRPLEARGDVAIPPPDYLPRFRHLLPVPLTFDAPRTAVVFDAALLDEPLPSADTGALQLGIKQCEQKLRALEASQSVVDRVRIILSQSPTGVPSLEETARRVHFSARTLKRQLAAHDTSYSELVDDARRTRALDLLRCDELSMDDIAERLGYTDVANFRRAFRRLTGTTPGRHRREKIGDRRPLRKQ